MRTPPLGGVRELVVMSPRKPVAARDPWGFRPLCMGRQGEAIVFASESCALDAVGAKEVHLRSSAPPFVSPCWFGTDIPSKEELIACRYSVEEIRRQIGADSLGFLSLDALHRIAPDAGRGFCDGCFTGHYPIHV